MKKLVKGLLNILLLLVIFKPMDGGLFSSNNSKVIAAYNEELNDEFYFIQGLDRERSLSTNIRYRGLLYSKKMKEAGVRGFLEIGIENLDNIMVHGSTYRSVLAGEKINKIFEDEAKKFFGDKVLLQNTTDGFFDEEWNKEIVDRFYKKIEFEKTYGFRQTFVTVFVKDIKKIDEREYRKKALDLANHMFKNLNMKTSLQIFIRNESYLEDYEKIRDTIASGFREDEEIKVILKKVKKKEAISEAEKLKLLSVMYRFFRDDHSDWVTMLVWMREKSDFPLKVIYSETEKGETTYKKAEED